MAYLCLHFTRNHEELKSNTPYPEDSIRRIEDYLKILEDIGPGTFSEQVGLVGDLGSTNDVLIPLVVLKSEDSIKEFITKAMTKLTLQEYMEEVQADYGSNTTTPRFNENAKFELRDEFLKILRDNAFNGINGDDVVDHTTKVLVILDLIKIPNVDPNQLRLHVFTLSLTGDARKWWIDKIDGKIITWGN
ncbi:hypothetical protein Tco_1484746 [Tanacetum coccineum]